MRKPVRRRQETKDLPALRRVAPEDPCRLVHLGSRHQGAPVTRLLQDPLGLPVMPSRRESLRALCQGKLPSAGVAVPAGINRILVSLVYAFVDKRYL